MKNGNFDLNTTNPSQINAAGKSLEALAQLTNVHIDNNDYTEIPSGQIWIHHAWSGDIAAAQYYMPKGVNVDVVGYWFPPDGRGPVANDTMTVLKGVLNPVLAHLFLNYMLDFQQCDDEHQLQRLHAAHQRRHFSAPGQGAVAATEPDVHGGAALLLQARGHAVADPGGGERVVAAGMAQGQERVVPGRRNRHKEAAPAVLGGAGRSGHHLARAAVRRALLRDTRHRGRLPGSLRGPGPGVEPAALERRQLLRGVA